MCPPFSYHHSPSPTMEWFTLFLITPLLLVPAVLLWGYAGCGFSVPLSPSPPNVPTNLMATTMSASSIFLSWSHEDDASDVSFEIERYRGDALTPEAVPVTTSTTYTDGGLSPLQRYRYKVRAVRAMESSEPSNEASATTLPLLSFSATLTTDQTGLAGFCIVQRIEPALAFGGNRVIIKIRGSTTGNLVIDRVFISQVAGTGNPYDSSAADLTLVASNVSIAATTSAITSVALPEVQYALDRTRPLLVIFDINAAAGNGNVRYRTAVPSTEAIMYFRSATAEAGTPDRLPSAANPGASPYIVSNSIYLIETIEVA